MHKEFFNKRLLPAITLSTTDSARALTEALLEAGLNVMEITFRTSSAASAIGIIRKEFPEMFIGAGTILSQEQISLAIDSGAQFGLAPGFNENVVRTAIEKKLPFIPGVMSPSEIENALNYDIKLLKLFPANNLGGSQFVKSLQGPYHHTGVSFIPMGGVKLTNISEYLQYPIVEALGGTWMAPPDWIRAKQFKKISKVVRESLSVIEEST